jgi:hypothetical protein
VQTWQGDLFITAVTPACERNGIRTNTYYRAVFRPRNIENNGPDTSISFFASANGHNYVFKNNGLASGKGPYSGLVITSLPTVISWSGTFSDASTKPAVFSATTPAVFVKIKMKNFPGVAGCDATFEGSFGNRPGL